MRADPPQDPVDLLVPVRVLVQLGLDVNRIGDVAAELARLGYVNERGATFSAASVASMLAPKGGVVR